MPLHFTNTTQEFFGATQKPQFMHRYSCKIIIRDDAPKKDGTCALSLQAFINGKRIVLPTGINVDPKHFSKVDRKIRFPKNLKQVETDYNLILSDCEARANRIFIQFRTSNIILSPDTFKRQYLNGDINMDFIRYAYKSLNQESHQLSLRAVLHHQRVLKMMVQFRPNWLMSDMTYSTLKAFDDWMAKRYHYKPNYIAKIHGTIKKYINIARKERIPIEDPYKQLKIRKVKSDPNFLTKSELQKLIDLRFDNDLPPTHREVLDAYLFAATSGGFRISDWHLLSEENIVGNQVVFMPHKTRKFKARMIRLELTELGMKLIEGRTGMLFELPSDQKVNQYLKDLALIAGISKRITSHTARHTFATQYLENGGKIEKLQMILGHSKLDETMIYGHVTDKSVSESMRVMNVFHWPGKSTTEDDL